MDQRNRSDFFVIRNEETIVEIRIVARKQYLNSWHSCSISVISGSMLSITAHFAIKYRFVGRIESWRSGRQLGNARINRSIVCVMQQADLATEHEP